MRLFGPFKNQTAIDTRFTGEGADVSPHLTWSQTPADTKSLALICDDPDAPSARRPAAEPWVHWVIFNISAATSELPDLPAEDVAARLWESEYQQHLVGRAIELMQAEFEPPTWKAFWESVARGRPAREVAGELGISVNAVYVAKSRVLGRLRRELDGLLD